MKIRNKVIVITGGTSGLGKSLATLLVKRKNKVIIASRSMDRILLGKKACALYGKTDVTKESDIKKLTKASLNKFKKIDIWINNAGIWIPHVPIENINMKKFHEMIEVNLFGVVYGSKHALKQMRKQKKGIIINILSSSALDGSAGSSGYCASKFAASGFTKSLRLEVCKEGISVISVYTRGMKTNLFNQRMPLKYHEFMNPDYVAEKVIKNIERGKPRQDLFIMN